MATDLHKNCNDLYECGYAIHQAIDELKENRVVKAFIILDEQITKLDQILTIFREEAIRQDKEGSQPHDSVKESK
jgi:hypothetical protein